MKGFIAHRLPGALWALAWMWPLIGAVITIGDERHPVLAALGLTAFVLLYLTVVTDGFDETREPNAVRDITLLVLCASLGLGLLWAYGLDNQWGNIILYVAVAGAVGLRTTPAVVWVAGSFAIFSIYCLGHGVPLSPWATLSFGILLASALVFTIKRMLIYIDELRATRAKLAETAVSEERLRFSRDLHDLLGHTLSLIVVKSEVVRRLAEHDPAAAAREAAEIEAIGRQALTEVREAVAGYREPDFATEVDGCRSALMDAGMTVRVTQPAAALPPPANTLFGWAVREAATNAIRHSGARTCTIAVKADGDLATLDVTDDGGGRRADVSTGTGLLGLRERFALVGGTVETSSQPGNGFRLVATVPIAAER